ncbi:calcium-binding and coiled-coil domain-containing protein 1b isoform X2 [Cheilinus undulatus]|uniref:calcium-binding and coiled-coil domain-containing protein 1b isoform X2 n=1 Tax=Cheilinus undulatus TaxID=241271 RepID=UPI001BD28C7C|nr:calcium-binding and coiled-coil domain-containing protein 1b isoform X2 [Cheilinus undulatus]
MDKQSTVMFRNVGQLYFPQTRVECHYSLTSEHRWSSSDWIGIFQVGWSSVKQYYTYTWAHVPEGYTEGSSVNCCALFHAFYLPCPSSVEYQFVYVDKDGEVCAQSRPFTFCSPKPLEELETLKEEQDQEDGEEELLLVIPRAQLLQSQLDECLQKQADIQRALDEAIKEAEKEKENSKIAKMEWELEREAMKGEITELRDDLRHKSDTLKKIEGKHKDVKYSQENLTYELSKLMAEKADSQQQVRDLQEDMKVLTEREKEAHMELERLKERMKKMSSQMKHDEEKRKSLQVENEAALMEVRGLQERLEAAEHVSESLRRELRELGTRQGHANTELHQARLQVAQLTLQLSEENLLLREERANWALEREAYKHAAEVLLSDAKQELQEVKASLRKVQREREEQQLDKQDLLNYIHQLEQRLGIEPENKSNGEVPACISPESSSESDQEVCSTSLSGAETLIQSREDIAAADTQNLLKQDSDPRAAEEKQLMLPEVLSSVLSELADSPMW